MIFDDLVLTSKSMQDLQKKVEIQKNKGIQDNTDEKYRVLTIQSNQLVESIDYIYKEIGIVPKKETIQSLVELVNNLEKTTDSGFASTERVTLSETQFKSIQGNMKKEWPKCYAELTAAKIGTLEAINKIDSEKVSSCLDKILCAENWDINVDNFKSLKQGLSESEQLVADLALDDEIVSFLQKTNEGKATLKSLSDKVLNWIKKEHLENKIRISFIKVQ